MSKILYTEPEIQFVVRKGYGLDGDKGLKRNLPYVMKL